MCDRETARETQRNRERGARALDVACCAGSVLYILHATGRAIPESTRGHTDGTPVCTKRCNPLLPVVLGKGVGRALFRIAHAQGAIPNEMGPTYCRRRRSSCRIVRARGAVPKRGRVYSDPIDSD